jgi:hypothetical protein
MLESKKPFQYFLLLLLTAFLLSGSLLASLVILKNQLDFQKESVEFNKPCSLTVVNAFSSFPYAISYDRNNQKQIDFIIKLHTKAQSIKLFFCFLLLFFVFKTLFKETFFIYLVRVNYFILDLDICILSAKAHPPTF